MAFGPDFPLKVRDDLQAEEWIGTEVQRNWEGRGLGDCAVGVWPGDFGLGKLLSDEGLDGKSIEARLVEGSEFEEMRQLFDEVQWVGYVGGRDSIPRLPRENLMMHLFHHGRNW